MFEDATFHSGNIHPTQARKWMLLTLAVNLAAVAAMIVLPLLHPGSLPPNLFIHPIYAPTSAPVATQQTHAIQTPSHPVLISLNPFQPPTHIPRSDPGTPPPASNPFISTSNESIFGATPDPSVFAHTNPPTVHPAQPDKPHKATISQGVAAGLLLPHILPTYPPIARTTGTSGTVVLAATISATGAIENLRVLSGSPMLTTAAVEAVKTWRYHPYQLNNQPVEVETTINVVFSIGGR